MGRIIYLPHPGGEHLSKNPGYKFDPKSIKKLEKGTMPWNNADKHARKFICSEGDYLDSTGKLHEQEKIAFWGEWEQESSFTKTRDGNLDENPDRVHTPLCVRTNIVREIESGRVFDDSFIQTCQQFYNKDKQNTDPYVFGSHFYYSCCRQTGVMLDLEVGDMIIFFSGFGKKPKRKFVLDTVFIVGGRVIPNKISYQEQLNVLRNLVSLQYLTGVILPICCGNNKSLSDSTSKMKPNNVLYYGAMYNDQSNQPERVYSFFPCKKAESDKGFSRYVLFDEETGEGLCRVLNVRNKTIDINQNVYSLWQLLQKDVQDKGFLIGVKANEPDYSDIEI